MIRNLVLGTLLLLANLSVHATELTRSCFRLLPTADHEPPVSMVCVEEFESRYADGHRSCGAEIRFVDESFAMAYSARQISPTKILDWNCQSTPRKNFDAKSTKIYRSGSTAEPFQVPLEIMIESSMHPSRRSDGSIFINGFHEFEYEKLNSYPKFGAPEYRNAFN